LKYVQWWTKKPVAIASGEIRYLAITEAQDNPGILTTVANIW